VVKENNRARDAAAHFYSTRRKNLNFGTAISVGEIGCALSERRLSELVMPALQQDRFSLQVRRLGLI
jgi:hypothetical protein